MAALTPAAWMVAAGLAGWAAIVVLGGNAVSPEAALGMAAPLVAVVCSWLVTARIHAADPARVTGVMVVGMAAKAILFAAYVVVIVRGVGVRPVPFALSFAGFFIGLYAMEAYFLRQLFAGPGRSVYRE
jgi:hypothetical protein